MTSETVTLKIHRDAPPEGMSGKVLAKKRDWPKAGDWPADSVRIHWHTFEWWSEIPAPVKPRWFVVEPDGDGYWCVRISGGGNYRAIRIPTPEAAQAIADIYEANQ